MTFLILISNQSSCRPNGRMISRTLNHLKLNWKSVKRSSKDDYHERNTKM